MARLPKKIAIAGGHGILAHAQAAAQMIREGKATKAPESSEYTPPVRPEGKGELGLECNRNACSNSPALYYNKSTRAHYCKACASEINDYARGDSYRLYGEELCTLDSSLTPEKIKEYEAQYEESFKHDPPSEIMDNSDLLDMPMGRPQYFDMNRVNKIYNTHNYFMPELSKKEQAEMGRAVDVKPRSNIGRNDPCPCTSGKKYKNCCLHTK